MDSGLDTTNPEFAGRISSSSADVAASRGVDNPDSTHGTQVALTAAAGRNGTGIMGIAWNATIESLRADSPGTCASTNGCRFSDSAIAAGIDRAVTTGAKVINISLGGSPPGFAVTAAIGRAATAGVVVVVSAGNDGTSSTTNPDDFAVGLRAAGNGNVIIAGSVDATGTISSFSNEAGTEQQWYLMALGERICCVYENGQIKITTDSSGQQFVTVVSGTSFSAPQISGAVALLRQAFPNLTATQVVDLLLRTARDAGAPGTDAVYGRGIMDIGAAFAPQGTTTLAGTTQQLPLGETTLVTSLAMGDAGKGAMLSATVLDSYQRAYKVSLGANLRTAESLPGLGAALLGQNRSVLGGSDAVALSFTVSGTVSGGLQAFGAAPMLRLSPRDAEAARVLAARIVARLSPESTLAFGYAMGSEGVVAQLQGQNRPAFLVSGDPTGDFGFSRVGNSTMALRRTFGAWGLTLAAEGGKVLAGSPYTYRNSLVSPRLEDGYIRFGAAADRRFGPLATSFALSWLDESRSVLGARLNPGLGRGGADSLFLDVAASWDPFARWRLGASYRRGWTRARPGGSVVGGSGLSSDAWALDVSRFGLFQAGDSLSLRIAQPLRVRTGGLNLLLPESYNYDTLAATSSVQRLQLSPRGREIDRELAWHGTLGGGAVTASLYWRSDPGNFADLPDDYGAGLSWTTRF